MDHGYPVVLDLRGQSCLVVGGSALAEEKVRGLLQAGARVTLVAPALEATLFALVQSAPALVWHKREATPADLSGHFLAVACSGDRAENERLAAAAANYRVLFNALDDPPHCRFIYPSLMRQGDLLIAISTSGKCPALAVRLRQAFEREFGPEYAEFLAIMGDLRPSIAQRFPDFSERKKIWYRLVDSDAIPLLREGRRVEAEALLLQIAEG
jgi:siroheme synthase-like protein